MRHHYLTPVAARGLAGHVTARQKGVWPERVRANERVEVNVTVKAGLEAHQQLHVGAHFAAKRTLSLIVLFHAPVMLTMHVATLQIHHGLAIGRILVIYIFDQEH